MSDAQKICAEILAGRHDGKLADINEAIRERVLSQATSLRWKISHPLVEVTEDDLTLEEAEQVERITKLTWASIDPYSSAVECRAILTVALQRRAGLSAADAAAETGKLTVTQATEIMSTYEVTAGPLEGRVPGGPAEPAGSSDPDGAPATT